MEVTLLAGVIVTSTDTAVRSAVDEHKKSAVDIWHFITQLVTLGVFVVFDVWQRETWMPTSSCELPEI